LGAIIRREDPWLDSFIGTDDLRGLVSPGSKELQADQRLDEGAITEAIE
jgi:hypothetical protein